MRGITTLLIIRKEDDQSVYESRIDIVNNLEEEAEELMENIHSFVHEVWNEIQDEEVDDASPDEFTGIPANQTT